MAFQVEQQRAPPVTSFMDERREGPTMTTHLARLLIVDDEDLLLTDLMHEEIVRRTVQAAAAA
jgi:hypothetical protein